MGNIDKLIIALVVFSVFVFGGIFLIGDMNNQYDDVSINTDKVSKINGSIDDLYETSTGMKDDVEGGEIDENTVENSMFKGSFKAIKLIGSTYKIMGDVIQTVAIELGIPSFFISAALIVLLVFVIFGLILLVFRIKG